MLGWLTCLDVGREKFGGLDGGDDVAVEIITALLVLLQRSHVRPSSADLRSLLLEADL